MLVKDWMNPDMVVVESNATLADVSRLMKEKNVLMVPVTEGGKLVGVVTDRDIKRASASDATTLDVHELLYLLNRIRIREIMSRNPVTVSPYDTVEETAQLLLEKNISGAPVVDAKGSLVGTITQRELFRVLISLTGVGKKGIQFAFLLDDRAGSIKEVADIIRSYGGRMVSILSTYEHAPEGKRFAYIRMHSVDPDKLDRLRSELEKKARLLYMIDQTGKRREFYLNGN
ncbi:MAG: CBS and ACT domain-containing protein [Thermodesulfobacteriota bacterium]